MQKQFADVEISSVEGDKLGRETFARKVAERIVRSGGGPSTVFGLAGKWGSGKTSTLNFISSIIKQEHGDSSDASQKWSVVVFTPWSCTDIEALTDEFYRAVATAMPDDAHGLKARTLLTRAAPFAAAVGKAAVTALVDKYLGEDAWQKMVKAGAESIADEAADEAAELAAQQPTFMQRYFAIADAIKRAGRNVLVIIDDVDRLHADELLGVMKAVRLLGRFDRVHYLLSYDEATVLDVLEATDLAHDDRGRARLYLEKIIQYPFALPPIQPQHLQSELKAQLKAVADTYALPICNSSKNWDAAVDRITATVQQTEQLTLRSIYRWCSQLDMLLTLVGPQEVDFADAALITFLRLWHNDIYVLLPLWRSELVYSQSDSENDLPRDAWIDRIAKVLLRVKDPAAPTQVYAIVSSLFPRLRQTQVTHNFAVGSREYFYRYFTLGFPLGDVPDLVIRGELEALATTGAIDDGGWLVGGIADPEIRHLVSSKAVRAAEVIERAPAATSVEGAHALARLLYSPDLMRTPYGHLVYLLLKRGVSDASGSPSATNIIDKFTAEFGAITAAATLYQRVNEPGPSDEAMVAASSGLRKAVIDGCVADLTSNISDTDPAALTIFRVLWYLDEGLWEELRTKAAGLLDGGGAGLADLGARFVHIQPEALGGIGVHEFRVNEFQLLVPKTQWSKYSVPQVEKDQIDFRDPSLSNRVAYAALNLRLELG